MRETLTASMLALSVLVGGLSSAEAQWKNFRADSQNSGSIGFNVRDLNTGVSSVRKFSTKGLIWSTAVSDRDQNVYVGSADKYMYSLDAQGQLRWKYKVYDNADALIDSGALITGENLLVIPGGDGYLHAVKRDTGEFVWDFKADGVDDDDHSSGVVVNSFEGNVTQGPGQRIYAGSDNGYMYCLNQSGELQWKFKTNMMIWSSPGFDPQDKWMAFGSLDKKLYLLDPFNGKKFDEINLKAEVKASPLVRVEDGQKFIYFGDANGRFYKYQVQEDNKTAGYRLKRIWRYKTKKEIYSSATAFKDHILVGSRNGKFYSINAISGKLNWVYDTLSVLASSPIVSKDGVVIFGARNGKVYALDVVSGERIWSYKTAPGNLKVNLDASPIMNRDGIIYNGSYSGEFYGIPYDYCRKQGQEDDRCESGGKVDLLSYIQNLEDGVYFFYEDRQGVLHKEFPNTVLPYEIVRLKLVVKKDGEYIKNAALWPRGLKVLSNADFDVKISSDSYFLNLRPKKALPAGEKLEIKIKGRYYKRTHWLADQFKFFSAKKYSAKIQMNVAEVDLDQKDVFADWERQDRSLGVRNMFLFQPLSLETYIPAALDGQYFVIKHLGVNKEGGFSALVLPAQKTKGVYSVMPWSNKAFILKGKFEQGQISLEGSFSLAAMGGTIPFKQAYFVGALDPEQGVKKGQMLTVSPCTKLEGNGDSFQFPISVIDDTCDHKLRLISVGKFLSDWAQTPPAQYTMEGAQISNKTGKEALLSIVKIAGDGRVSKDLYTEKIENNGVFDLSNIEKQEGEVLRVYLNAQRIQ
jgi:outer membrane protein assembly factor BamB